MKINITPKIKYASTYWKNYSTTARKFEYLSEHEQDQWSTTRQLILFNFHSSLSLPSGPEN